MTRPIYVPAIGQYDNIGDIILRRPLLDALRQRGPLHVYIGNAPDGYAEGLQVRPGDTIYRSFRRWYLAALRDAIRGGIVYVFKPGEIQMSLPGMKEHLSALPLLALSRARGGVALRVGVGSRNFSRRFRPLFMPSVRLSDLSLWRDARTQEFVGKGEVMPDLAFREGSSPSAWPSQRSVLVVSMRSDRPYPSEAWIRAVRAYADVRGFEIWTVTQVLRDEARSRRLAADLDGKTLGWDGTAHHAQEERLRELYSRTAVAVSDRLHVLIGAFTEGARPVALLVDDSDKIRRHFAAAGIEDITIAGARLSQAELMGAIIQAAETGRSVDDRLAAVRRELDDRLSNIDALIKRPAPSEAARA